MRRALGVVVAAMAAIANAGVLFLAAGRSDPPALRAYASLDKHVVLVGQGLRFELWGHAQWQAQTAQDAHSRFALV